MLLSVGGALQRMPSDIATPSILIVRQCLAGLAWPGHGQMRASTLCGRSFWATKYSFDAIRNRVLTTSAIEATALQSTAHLLKRDLVK